MGWMTWKDSTEADSAEAKVNQNREIGYCHEDRLDEMSGRIGRHWRYLENYAGRVAAHGDRLGEIDQKLLSMDLAIEGLERREEKARAREARRDEGELTGGVFGHAADSPGKDLSPAGRRALELSAEARFASETAILGASLSPNDAQAIVEIVRVSQVMYDGCGECRGRKGVLPCRACGHIPAGPAS